MCFHVEVSALGWSLVQRSTTECGVSEYDCEAAIMRRPCPTRGRCTMVKKSYYSRGLEKVGGHHDVKNMWRYNLTFVCVGLYFLSSETIPWLYLHCKNDTTLRYAGSTKHVRVSQFENPWCRQCIYFGKGESYFAWKRNVKCLCQYDYLLVLYTFLCRRDVTDWRDWNLSRQRTIFDKHDRSPRMNNQHPIFVVRMSCVWISVRVLVILPASMPTPAGSQFGHSCSYLYISWLVKHDFDLSTKRESR